MALTWAQYYCEQHGSGPVYPFALAKSVAGALNESWFMDVRGILSDDGQALLALCSPFALTEDRLDEGRLHSRSGIRSRSKYKQSPWKRPGRVARTNADAIAKTLPLSMAESERNCLVLERSGCMALELEYFSRGLGRDANG